MQEYPFSEDDDNGEVDELLLLIMTSSFLCVWDWPLSDTLSEQHRQRAKLYGRFGMSDKSEMELIAN